jgi:hypothetical protein
MALSTREQLQDYCLRRLGWPVVEINVDEDQVTDRIDDALQFFQEYHFDGVERTYVKHRLTGSTVRLNLSVASSFTVGETITGATSGAKAIVKGLSGNQISVEESTADWVGGESITGSESGYTAAVSLTNPYEKGDIENNYIPIGNGILGINRVFNFGGTNSLDTEDIFNIDYQFRLNDLYNLLGADMIYYSMVKQNLQSLEQLLMSSRQIRWNRKTNRLYIDTDWDKTFNIGDYIVAEAFAIVDPETYTEVYDDMFLKKYATALIKRQWGENMKKFGGIQLPGGVTLNGKEVYDEAIEEIRMIEQEMQSKYELPPSFMVG